MNVRRNVNFIIGNVMHYYYLPSHDIIRDLDPLGMFSGASAVLASFVHLEVCIHSIVSFSRIDRLAHFTTRVQEQIQGIFLVKYPGDYVIFLKCKTQTS